MPKIQAGRPKIRYVLPPGALGNIGLRISEDLKADFDILPTDIGEESVKPDMSTVKGWGDWALGQIDHFVAGLKLRGAVFETAAEIAAATPGQCRMQGALSTVPIRDFSL